MTAEKIVKALRIVAPGAEWHLSGDGYENLIWLDESPKPTEQDLKSALVGE